MKHTTYSFRSDAQLDVRGSTAVLLHMCFHVTDDRYVFVFAVTGDTEARRCFTRECRSTPGSQIVVASSLWFEHAKLQRNCVALLLQCLALQWGSERRFSS